MTVQSIREAVRKSGNVSKVEKEIRDWSDKELQNLIDRADLEFKARPNLNAVHYVSYAPRKNSLGRGCNTLRIEVNGNVSISWRQGSYGCIMAV